jgi:NAD(P)H-nitrite reductase large subunit
MAVSGCHLSCSEFWVRDVWHIEHKEGWTLVIGGNLGASPRIAHEGASGLDGDEVVFAIERVLGYYQVDAKKEKRLGKMIDRVGIEVFQQTAGEKR